MRIIKRPILVSSSGRFDIMSHSLSKTKGHLPQGVQLDIYTGVQRLYYSNDHYSILHRQSKEQQYTRRPTPDISPSQCSGG